MQDIERPSREKGLNRIAWNLRFGGPEVRRPPTEEQVAFGGGPRGPQVLPGTYTVKLTVNDKTFRRASGSEVRSDHQHAARGASGDARYADQVARYAVDD